MLGYVKAEKAELKMREWEVYSAYYCGVCKSVGRRFGHLERMTLSYDFAFLALLLGGLSEEADNITPEHCLIHPVKKKNISASTPQIDYAGDMMLLLAYYNLLDDINDDDKGSFKDKIGAKAGEKILHRNVKKLQLKYDRICGEIESQLALLSKLEKEKCSSPDQAAEPFAILMGEVFAGGVEGSVSFKNIAKSDAISNATLSSAATLRQLGRALGKWIYLADAFDDLEEDMASGSYNPFVCRFAAELQAGCHSRSQSYVNRAPCLDSDSQNLQNSSSTSSCQLGVHMNLDSGQNSCLNQALDANPAQDLGLNRSQNSGFGKGSDVDSYSDLDLSSRPEPGPDDNPSSDADTQLTFKDRIRDRASFSLMTCLSEIGKAYDLLDIKKNGGILENIIYFGLLRRTENLLTNEERNQTQ